jgi:hypothetical protein
MITCGRGCSALEHPKFGDLIVKNRRKILAPSGTGTVSHQRITEIAREIRAEREASSASTMLSGSERSAKIGSDDLDAIFKNAPRLSHAKREG